jgi:hypothetical protein
MKKCTLILKVEDDFKRGDCRNCPLSSYDDDFGEIGCYEFELQDNDCDCPIIIESEE